MSVEALCVVPMATRLTYLSVEETEDEGHEEALEEFIIEFYKMYKLVNNNFLVTVYNNHHDFVNSSQSTKTMEKLAQSDWGLWLIH